MKKIVFAGCSFTAGTGLDSNLNVPHCKHSPDLWCNLVHQKMDRFQNCEQINVGQPGASNSEIFEKTVETMVHHDENIDTVFCQWTAMPRYNFNVGFELWGTTEESFSSHNSHDHRLSDGTVWTRKHISDLVDQLKVMHHLHWEILKVVRFSNILTQLAQKLNIPNILFINGLCPWDKDYFTKLENVEPENYTDFTKNQIINITARNDNDIYKLYNLAHQHYQQAGGINESRWINLYRSLISLRVDYNYDGSHPGIKSNKLFFETIKHRLQQLNFC